MLGIDGSGKSSVAAQLRVHFEATGREVVDASTDALFTEARRGKGHPWDALNCVAQEGWRLFLLDPPLQSAVLASGMLELNAYCLARAEVIAPAVERGAVVISDSYCLKNVVRTLRQAQQMEGALSAAVDDLLSGIRVALSSPHLQPDVGLHFDADPAITTRWRIAQRGALEPGADMSVAGQPGLEAALRLQSALAAELCEDAQAWGWNVLPVDGRPLSETVAAALNCVMSHPSQRGER
ncbi:hypothetical protein [Streptomyces sp. CAU 1734]|uniref:hypothetical protein n=1 Tax=Streptomyces sp. CAU 1734 TaxID=3140360 RepID=UPI003260D8CB